MATEDLLVNIEVETKPAKRGVDDLNKSLAENAKQTKKIQAELQKLEKEYKSIATAVNKLPSAQVGKMAAEVKKAEKATSKLHDQFDRTEQKLARVKDRTIGASESFAVLASTMTVLANLDAPIRFSNQVVKAAQAVLQFNKTAGPLVKDTIRLMATGFDRTKTAISAFAETFKLIGPAIREQVQLLRGFHVVTIRSAQLSANLTEAFTALSRGASHVNRALVGMREFVQTTGEGITRITRVFKTMGEAMSTVVTIAGELQQAWFSTFGASSGGAAQINRFEKLLLSISPSLLTFVRNVKVDAAEAFEALSKGILSAARNFVPLVTQMAKLATLKGAELLQKGLSNLGPALIKTVKNAEELAFWLDTKMAAGVNKFFAAMVKGGVGAVNFGQQLGLVGKGFLGALDATNLFGAGLLGLGGVLKKTDSAFLQTIGSALQMAGVFTLSLSAGATILIGVIGQLAASVGGKLFAVLDKWEEKFVALQGVTKAFEFVVAGFGRTMGTATVGSLEFWNETIEKTVSSTVFGAAEVQKAIKILVAEGSNLGITAKQNAEILARSSDIAAATGNDLAHVALAIARGLAGNAGSLQDMGIFVDQAALQHSKYAHAQNLVISNLSRQDRAQVALNAILEQTVPLVGAGAAQLNTLGGATKQYGQTVDQLEAKLGSVSSVFVLLKQAQTAVIKAFADLPEGVHDLIGNFLNLLAITLKVGGTFLSIVITATSLKGIFDLLSFAVARSAIAQGALNIVLNVVNVKLGLQAVTVKTLGGAMMATANIGVTALIRALTTFQAMVVGSTLRAIAFTESLLFTRAGWAAMTQGALLATASLARFTVAILTNPLFINGAAIAVAIYSVSEAFASLNKELAYMQPQTAAVAGSATVILTSLQPVVGIFGQMAQVFSDFVKRSVIGWLLFGKGIDLAILGYKKLWEATKGVFTDTSGEMGKLNAEQAKIKAEAQQLSDAFHKTFDPNRLVQFDARIAELSASMNQLGAAAAAAGRGFSGSMKLSDEDASAAKIEVLGTAFEKANERFAEANRLLGNLRNQGVIKVGTEILMPTKENIDRLTAGLLDKPDAKAVLAPAGADVVNKQAIEAEKARLEIIKLRQDASKDLAQTMRDLEKVVSDGAVKELESSKQVLAALRMRGEEELKAFREKFKAISATNALYKQAEAAIKASTAAAILQKELELAEEQLKKGRKKLELLDALGGKMRELNLATLQAGDDSLATAEAELALQLQKISALEHEAEKLGALGAAYKEILAAARALAKEKFEEMKPFTVGSLVAAFGAAFASVKEMSKGLFSDVKLPASLAEIGPSLAAAFKSIKLPSMDDLKNVGKDLKDAFMSIDLGALGAGIADGAAAGFQGILAMFDPDNINKVADFFGEFLEKLPDAIGKAFEKLDKIIGKFIDAFPKLIMKILDALPGLVQSILDKIPALIDALAAAIGSILDKLPDILGRIFNALPGIIESIMKALPTIVTKIFSAIGQIVTALIKAIPDIVRAFVDGLPALISAIIEGFLGAVGDIVAAIIDFLIGGGLEKVVGAILRAIPKIVGAIISGLWKGLVKMFGAIFGGIKAPPALAALPGKFAKGIKDLAKKATQEASKLFKVMDLEAATKGLTGGKSPADAGKEALEAIGKATKGFFARLKEAWMWVYDHILKPIGDIVYKAWKWVYDNIFEPIASVVQKAWQWVVDKVLAPIAGIIQKAWQWVYDKVIGPLAGVVQQTWQWVSDNVVGPMITGLQFLWDGVKLIFDQIIASFQLMWDGVLAAWELLRIGFQLLWDGVKIMFDAVIQTFAALWAGVKIIWDGIIGAFQGVVDIFKGIWDTLKNVVSTAFEGIVDFFKNIFKGNIKEAFEGLWENFKKVGGIIMDGLKAAWDKSVDVIKGLGGKIWEGLKTAFDGAGDAIKSVGTKMWDGLKAAFSKAGEVLQGLGTKIWDGLKSGLASVGDYFSDIGSNIWESVKSGLSGIGDFVSGIFSKLDPTSFFSKIFNLPPQPGPGKVEDLLGINIPFITFAQGGMVPGQAAVSGDSAMNDRVVAMLSPGEAIVPRSVMEDPHMAKMVRSIIDGKYTPPKFYFGEGAVNKVVGGAKDAGGAVSGGLKDIGNAVAKGVQDFDISDLDPRKQWEKAKEEGMKVARKILEANKFHDGGFVPHFANGGEVPALLQQGEFVINRQAVKSLGLGALGQMNRTGTTGTQVFNFDVKLDVRSDGMPDEAFIRQKLIPAFKKELKDASIKGDFLMSSKGIRQT